MDDHLDQDALLKRIEELEKEKHTMMTELSNLKKNMSSSDAACPQKHQNFHDFVIQLKEDQEEYQSLPHYINNVGFVVNIQRKMPKVDNWGKPLTDILFILTLKINNNDPTDEKFVIFSVDVKLPEDFVQTSEATTPPCPSFSQKFVLCGDEERTIENQLMRQLLINGSWKIKICLSAVVQTLEHTEIEADNTAIVIVKHKEFRVSVDYLSMWSSYFRAYFRVDMKEKQEGRYPIGDEEIEPEDFQDLLDVIHPNGKEITKRNYLLLLQLANRFEMPALIRRIELFMINFDTNKIRLDNAFRIATDRYSLKIVQTMLLHRWRDAHLMEEELLKSDMYDRLSEEAKHLVWANFNEACISSNGTNLNRADRRGGSPPHRRGFGNGNEIDRGRGGFNDRAQPYQRGFGFGDRQYRGDFGRDGGR